MEDIKETQPEIIETESEPEPLLKETKKAKKERTQKQLDAFEKARKKRLENINAKKMAVKEKEVAEYKKQKVEIEPVKEVVDHELTPNNPEYETEEVEPEVRKPKPKSKPKPKKKKPKTPPPSSDEEEDSSSSEEEYIIRKRKPTRNKRKTKVEKEELEQAVEAEQDRYYQNIIFV